MYQPARVGSIGFMMGQVAGRNSGTILAAPAVL